MKTNSDMKELFKTIPNLKSLIRVESGEPVDLKSIDIKNTLLSKNPSLIGHAYDYFLQLFCLRINNAADAYDYMLETLFDFPEIDQDVFSDNAWSYIKGFGAWNEDLTRQSIVCGKLDQYHRSRIIPENILDIEQIDIDDLNNLIIMTLNHENIFKSEERFISNPTFGADISFLVGGADGDLIINKTLIDIKVNSKIHYESYPWHQLIGYYLLSQLTPNIDYSIDRLAIWNPRYEIFMYICIHDLNTKVDIKSFCYQFIKLLNSIHKNGLQNSLIAKKIISIESIWNNKRKLDLE
ncbi:hypothetical protein OB236_09630 [Paenibacillus sp. WQ 127069]|uniref:BsaWI restriction endonuclease type 2 domain-containing protein n=1 Tax=Paenibacillus baimaensis TaxID=2982185 RepID=A0ABT2UCM2_9BACL|nr:hypothetical protein [Paenibacillus sp. WQ 127069]